MDDKRIWMLRIYNVGMVYILEDKIYLRYVHRCMKIWKYNLIMKDMLGEYK